VPYAATILPDNQHIAAQALNGVPELPAAKFHHAVQGHLNHLDQNIGHSAFDKQDQAAALQQDRQGLGQRQSVLAQELGLLRSLGDYRRIEAPDRYFSKPRCASANSFPFVVSHTNRVCNRH